MAGSAGTGRYPGVADDGPSRGPAGAPPVAGAHRVTATGAIASGTIAPDAAAQGSQAIQPPACKRTAAGHIPQRPIGTGAGPEGSWTLSAPPSADSATRPGAVPAYGAEAATGESPAVRPAGAHRLCERRECATQPICQRRTKDKDGHA